MMRYEDAPLIYVP